MRRIFETIYEADLYEQPRMKTTKNEILKLATLAKPEERTKFIMKHELDDDMINEAMKIWDQQDKDFQA